MTLRNVMGVVHVDARAVVSDQVRQAILWYEYQAMEHSLQDSPAIHGRVHRVVEWPVLHQAARVRDTLVGALS